VISAPVFAAAYVLDLVSGDPPTLPHPVRLIGLAIEHGEKLLRPRPSPPAADFARGAVLTSAIVFGTTAVSYLLLRLVCHYSHPACYAISVYLASTTIATRCLIDEALAVRRLLKLGDLEAARLHLGRIVGRDTMHLEESEIVRATVETLAESTCDGIVAPIVYLALGGVPAAMAYKAINTLDSMIGHNDECYRYFGKCAARLDDIANLLPARITAVLITVAAIVRREDWRGAWRTWQRDAGKHSSPNAGRPEAAMAGALGVRLGGVNYYAGEIHVAAFLGESRRPLEARTIERALGVVGVVSFGIFVCSLAWTIYLNAA
jgi:adenosylcobinamide-phosphate synthase